MFVFFFFQAEDGIRDRNVTGVQTCALPISIYVMAADGSRQTQLTNSGLSDTHPTWSPDGTQIAFTSTRDGNRAIYVMNADGSGQTRLTTGTASDAQPSWSPTLAAPSKTLAFATQPPARVVVGAVMSPPVQVAVQDSLGNTILDASDTVTLAF